MNVIIVDDELRGISALKKMLEVYCPTLKVVAECRDAVTARNDILTTRPDLVFLDIAMPGQSGIELLESLPEINFSIIFVTAYNEYVIQALRYSAVDYLLKPVDEKLLLEAVKKVEKKIFEQQTAQSMKTLLHNLGNHPDQPLKLCIATLNGFQVVDLHEIIYCEAKGNYTEFYLKNNISICASKTLSFYENLLSGTMFTRVHKSFLINLSHVREYRRGEGGIVVMSNKAEIEISRRKKDEFLLKIREKFRY